MGRGRVQIREDANVPYGTRVHWAFANRRRHGQLLRRNAEESVIAILPQTSSKVSALVYFLYKATKPRTVGK